jgi:hypothetical protein
MSTPYQHQRWTRTERGNSLDMCAPILAADEAQGGRVAFVGPSVLRLTIQSKLGGGFARRPFPILIARRGRSSLLRSCQRMARPVSPLPDPSRARHPHTRNRVGRGGSAFVAAPASLHVKSTNHVCQDTPDWSEHHSVKSFRGGVVRCPTQPREAQNDFPEKRTIGSRNDH